MSGADRIEGRNVECSVHQAKPPLKCFSAVGSRHVAITLCRPVSCAANTTYLSHEFLQRIRQEFDDCNSPPTRGRWLNENADAERQSLDDGVYAVPGLLIRAADGSRARFVGNRPGTEIRWQANRHLWFQGDYEIFYAGHFLKETQPGRNLNYWALWTGYRF